MDRTHQKLSPIRVNALAAFIEGRRLIKVVPGLRAAIWKSFILNLALFGGFFAGLYWLGLHYFLEPMELMLLSWLPGWLDWSAHTLRVGLTLLLIILSLFLAILLPLNLLFIWYERLVSKVLDFLGTPHHQPPVHVSPVTSILIGVRDILILVLAVFLGFIPVMGPAVAFILSAHVMGRATFDPYIGVMKSRGFNISIPEKKFGFTTIAIGSLEAGLPFYIPIVGLFLIPWCIVHMVIGVASIYESHRGLATGNQKS
ncbi:MAG: hypothetical protein LR011_12910 [Verrucomicrobia bacterium]|nr:hypothetical protein [Verrucomicrobiota bacterium]